MKINFALNGIQHTQMKKRNFAQNSLNYVSSPACDTFVKSSNVSFKAAEKSSRLNDVLAVGGAVTLAAIPTIVAVAVAKKQNTDDIFLSDGTYLGNVNDFKADAQAAKEAGIDLSKERFTFQDPINGVFKNPDKGIDINFTQGKYIDPENGIFMDKETGMSAVYNNGHFDPVAVPDVSFRGFYDPTCVSMPQQYPLSIPREEFINEHNQTPEDFYNNVRPSHPEYGFTPIDRRSIYEKAKDWVTGKEPNDTDFWGREVVDVKDATGNIHRVPLDDKLSDIIHDRHMSYEDVQHFITYQAEHPIAGYIAENTPQHLSDYNFDPGSMKDFIANASIHHDSSISGSLPYSGAQDLDTSFTSGSEADIDMPEDPETDFGDFDGMF